MWNGIAEWCNRGTGMAAKSMQKTKSVYHRGCWETAWWAFFRWPTVRAPSLIPTRFVIRVAGTSWSSHITSLVTLLGVRPIDYLPCLGTWRSLHLCRLTRCIIANTKNVSYSKAEASANPCVPLNQTGRKILFCSCQFNSDWLRTSMLRKGTVFIW